MIDHTGIPVSDPARARAFYDAALGAIGAKLLMTVPKEFTGGRWVAGYGRSKAGTRATHGPHVTARVFSRS